MVSAARARGTPPKSIYQNIADANHLLQAPVRQGQTTGTVVKNEIGQDPPINTLLLQNGTYVHTINSSDKRDAR